MAYDRMRPKGLCFGEIPMKSDQNSKIDKRAAALRANLKRRKAKDKAESSLTKDKSAKNLSDKKDKAE